MLSLTADNASANDTLTTELAKQVQSFGGELSWTRCFLHIVNLIAKSIIRQFDIPKNESVMPDDDDDDEAPEALDVLDDDDDVEEQLLQELAKGVAIDDERTIAERGEGNPEDANIDDIDGWVDEVANLSPAERAGLHKTLRPVKLVFVKVGNMTTHLNNADMSAYHVVQLRKLAFKIIHSTTLFLPAWKMILDELQLPIRIMPCDVSTRWNSTFDMLDFAIEYRQALDDFTGDRKFGLRKLELSESEWEIAKQLRDTLLVSHSIVHDVLIHGAYPDLKGCNHFLFTLYPKPCYCDPCNGSYRRDTNYSLIRQEPQHLNLCISRYGQEDTQQVLLSY